MAIRAFMSSEEKCTLLLRGSILKIYELTENYLFFCERFIEGNER